MNTYNVIDFLFAGKRYRPNDEQRKTEHGLIQLKSEDSNAKNMSMSFFKSSTVQNESEKEVYNDVGFAKSFCQSDSSNQTQHVPDVSSHTTNTNDIAVKRIDGTCKNYAKNYHTVVLQVILEITFLNNMHNNMHNTNFI